MDSKTNHSNILFYGAAVLVLVLVTLVYGNHFQNSFHFDDSHTIVNNLAIRELNISRFFSDGSTFSSLPQNQSYRPVVTTLNAIDYRLGGSEVPRPFMYHVSIFVSFVITGLLVFLFVLEILRKTTVYRNNKWVALFTAAWFGLHTANAETVNYIIARSDSFSTLMVLLAFTLYLYRPGSRKFHVYLLPMIVGFFAKEPAILFVPLLFLYKLFFEADISFAGIFRNGKAFGKVLKEMAVPLLVALAIYLVYHSLTPSTWTPGGSGYWPYVMTQPYVILHYFNNFLLPLDLVVDTDWQPVSSFADMRVIAGIFFIFLLLVAAVVTSRERSYRPVSFGILWFLAALAPTSLIPFAEVMNDHRTFFPYIGLFLAAATLIRNLMLRFQLVATSAATKRWVILISCMFLAMHGYGTYRRNQVWHTEASLWKEATVKAPANGRAWMNYGLTLMAAGDYESAEQCYLKAMQIWPRYAYIYINMGILKSATGEMVPAEQYFRQALALDPNSPECYSYYAEFLTNRQRYSEAAALVDKGLALSPAHPQLARLHQMLGQTRLSASSVSVPESPEGYLSLSLEYYNGAKYRDCIAAAQKALSLKPDYDLAYNNICAAYNQLGEWDKAIEAGEKGLALNPGNEQIRANLQVSYNKGKP